MIFAADPILNAAIGILGLALCLANYKLLTFRRPGTRTALLFTLNHVALGAMLTGLAVAGGAGLNALPVLWLGLALTVLGARRIRAERAEVARRLRPARLIV